MTSFAQRIAHYPFTEVFVYDPARVNLIFGAIPVSGFADGTFLAAERDEDTYQTFVGTNGEVARARNGNAMGKVTFTLAQGSPANDALSAIALLDENLGSGNGVFPVLIKDNPGRTLVAAQFGWLVRPPRVDFGRESLTREWVIQCSSLQIFAGGLAGAGRLVF